VTTILKYTKIFNFLILSKYLVAYSSGGEKLLSYTEKVKVSFSQLLTTYCLKHHVVSKCCTLICRKQVSYVLSALIQVLKLNSCRSRCNIYIL
jgi:hypothetical protein